MVIKWKSASQSESLKHKCLSQFSCALTPAGCSPSSSGRCVSPKYTHQGPFPVCERGSGCHRALGVCPCNLWASVSAYLTAAQMMVSPAAQASRTALGRGGGKEMIKHRIVDMACWRQTGYLNLTLRLEATRAATEFEEISTSLRLGNPWTTLFQPLVGAEITWGHFRWAFDPKRDWFLCGYLRLGPWQL